MNGFVSQDFEVPETLVSEKFKLEILAPPVAKVDYEAVMSSKSRLRMVFGVQAEWPRENMTLEDNVRDLEMHEEEFKTRKAFAYSILTPSGDRALGTIYIDPSRVSTYDCEVQFWLRDDSIRLDAELYRIFKEWMSTCWKFSNIVYPGRSISWKNWNQILDKNKTA